jgi:hypothetical protein
MVRDAYSAGGQPQLAEDGAATQTLDSAANLTQELALLLAQSVGQAGKRPPGNGAAAGSELANLAALVSASQSQRPMQPAFRDGLSSLTYARPAQAPLPPQPPAPPPAPMAVVAAVSPMPIAPGMMPTSGGGLMPTGGGLLVTEPHDEEPMPIPSTWRQPVTNDDERWYRQQLGAAGLGLLAGLVVVVPAVLWLSGWIGGTPKTATAARPQPAAEAPRTAEVPQVKVRFNTASAEARVPAAEPQSRAAPVELRAPAAPEPRISAAVVQPPAEPTPSPRVHQPPARVEAPVVAAVSPPPAILAPPRAEPPPPPARSRADELAAQARRLIEGREIMAARDLLQATETSTSGALTFMLAETYDPSMLAIWQVKPDGITANPERARALYIRARDLGEARAQQRLSSEWLR